MACISRWLVLSYSNPITCETLALSGTAETPAFPINGLIFCPSFRKRLIILTNITPPKVATINEMAPIIKISSDFAVKKVVAWVEAPTVSPIRMVTISIRGPLAVSASLLVTVLSLSRFPKNSIPKSGSPEGTMKAVRRIPTIGNKIFSSLVTCLGGFIRITRSFLVVSNLIIGG